MAKVCQVTGRKPRKGKSYTVRGIAKKKKGIGLNITGSTKRRFEPNLFKKRFWLAEEERFVTLKVSAKGIRLIDKHGLAAVLKQIKAKGHAI